MVTDMILMCQSIFDSLSSLRRHIFHVMDIGIFLKFGAENE